MTNSQLEKIANTWQKRLRLQNWNIKITFEDNLSGTAIGECDPHCEFLDAKVRIRANLPESEIELTVIHELLHLRFPHVNPGWHDMFQVHQLIGNEFETGIEMIARALQDAYKKK